MTEPATDDDADDFDAPLTLQDRIEIIADDLDEAVDALTEGELEQLIRATRRKLAEISGDGEPVSSEQRAQYWWQRD